MFEDKYIFQMCATLPMIGLGRYHCRRVDQDTLCIQQTTSPILKMFDLRMSEEDVGGTLVMLGTLRADNAHLLMWIRKSNT